MTLTVFYKFCMGLTMVLVLFSSKWFFIWILMELGTLILVVLLSRHLSPRAVEATSKYFMHQAIASMILLLGILIRGFVSGEVSLHSSYSGVSYVLMILGLLMKLAAFPNPFWFIDVVSGLSLFRSFYVIMVSKMIPMYLLMTLMNPSLWIWFSIIGLFTAAFGSLLGTNQTSIRKMMALSSVAHLGWMIVGFIYMSDYMCMIMFMSYILMLGPILWLGGSKSLNYLSKSKSMYYSPMVMMILLVSLLSLGGFPPLLGFFYKWVIFQGLALKNNYMVGGALIILSLISLFFYLQICYSLYSLYWPNLKFSIWGAWLSYSNMINNLFILMMVSFFSCLLCLAIFLVGPIGTEGLM